MKRKLTFLVSGIVLNAGLAVLLTWSNLPSRSWWITVDIACLLSLLMALVNSWQGYLVQVTYRLAEVSSIERPRIVRWRQDGVDALQHSVELIGKKLSLAVEHITRIGQGERSAVDPLLKEDAIGEALVMAQDQIRNMEKEKAERNWISEGIALFSEIFRDKKEIKEYSQLIVNNLVRYLDVNQGGMYVTYHDQDQGDYLELAACVAYNKKKYVTQRIYEGQGMLGQNMVEKHFVFMTDVPQDYLKITSGLGEALPANVIIAPLVFKDKYYGAIELASFHVLKKYQVEFLQVICENIAGEIASIQTFQQTQRLLDESTNLAYELKEHDKVMQQNIEELAATQDEMTRKQTELNSYLKAINNTIAAVEFDMNGKFVTANDIFMAVMGFGPDELAGCDYCELMHMDSAMEMMWDSLQQGKFFSGEFRMKSKKGNEMWLAGTFNPITSQGDEPDKIMMYAQFTTQEKTRIHDLNAMVHAFKSTLPVVELSCDFVCKTGNDKFLKLFNLSRLELRKQKLEDLVAPYYKEVFDALKEDILTNDFSTALIPIRQANKIVTYEVTLSIHRDLEGNATRIILIFVKKVEEQVAELAAI